MFRAGWKIIVKLDRFICEYPDSMQAKLCSALMRKYFFSKCAVADLNLEDSLNSRVTL